MPLSCCLRVVYTDNSVFYSHLTTISQFSGQCPDGSKAWSRVYSLTYYCTQPKQRSLCFSMYTIYSKRWGNTMACEEYFSLSSFGFFIAGLLNICTAVWSQRKPLHNEKKKNLICVLLSFIQTLAHTFQKCEISSRAM